ncbi:phosphoglycerate mutase [Lactobacillus selangorensis]|uniref:Phosphoglycerate mutase n=1 Tax=Lactobacillus selangorensis TaxID=81857 RepID=A0A0R2FQX1_9LACO|nr:histidine phosphatase family protein [Lactobacillus selangorensis]KRN28219.1 phosphoglycerate mutase [Lactobacillus selangorensis]KRN30905.1 phosphoglycerate mutase [Lactobacillus selangorensis]
MKELYLMRHGETLFNRLHRIQGASDSPLTAQGIADAKKVGQYLTAHHITFDHAYSSTQERASDTLELVTNQPYKRLKGLKEQNFGVFEGESEVLNPKPKSDKEFYGDFFVQYGGESDQQVSKRMKATLTKVMEQPGHERVLAVSHAGASYMFLQNWIPNSEIMGHIHFANCSLLHFTYADQQFHFLEVIDPLHQSV